MSKEAGAQRRTQCCEESTRSAEVGCCGASTRRSPGPLRCETQGASASKEREVQKCGETSSPKAPFKVWSGEGTSGDIRTAGVGGGRHACPIKSVSGMSDGFERLTVLVCPAGPCEGKFGRLDHPPRHGAQGGRVRSKRSELEISEVQARPLRQPNAGRGLAAGLLSQRTAPLPEKADTSEGSRGRS